MSNYKVQKGILYTVIFAGVFIIGYLLSFFIKQAHAPIRDSSSPVVAENEAIVSFPTRNVSVIAEVADTKAKQELGLSGREALLAGHGMWFVFSKPDLYGFWMKDMKFHIDIIWLDENLKVVHFEQNVSTESYPKVFKTKIPSLYVLEVLAGFVAEYRLAAGDRAEIKTGMTQ